MKKLFLCILLVCSFNTLANEIILREAHESELYHGKELKIEFVANPQLKRAWIELNFFDRYQDGGQDQQTVRIKLPELKYNDETKEAYLDYQGIITICAFEKKFLFTKYLKETGKCFFTKEFFTTEVDDGFYIKKEKRYRLILNY